MLEGYLRVMVRAIPANMSLNIEEAVSTIIPVSMESHVPNGLFCLEVWTSRTRVYTLMPYMFLDNIEGACSSFRPMYAHFVRIDFDTRS